MEPDESRIFPGAEADLFVGRSLVGPNFPANRLNIRYNTGETDEVLVYEESGERRVARIHDLMVIGAVPPPISAPVTFRQGLAPVEGDDRVRILKMYDAFGVRSFKE
jgi:hypothetical protein